MGEKLRRVEKASNVEIPKSLDLYRGNLETSVGYAFNDAVIRVQLMMGPDFYLTPTSFGEIMSSNWAGKKVGQALAEFDKVYERFVLAKLGYGTEEIELATSEPEDEEAQEALVELEAEEERETGDEAGADETGEEPEATEEKAAQTKTSDEADEEPEETLDEPVKKVAYEVEALLLDHPELTVEDSDELAEAMRSQTQTANRPVGAQTDAGAGSKTEDKTVRIPDNLEMADDNADAPDQSENQKPEKQSEQDSQNERRLNLEAFAALLSSHPELQSVQAKFIRDLDNYLRERYTDAKAGAKDKDAADNMDDAAGTPAETR